MTLLEYIERHPESEIVVHDVDYDIEVYFYTDEPEDDWDRSMRRIASQLTVIEETDSDVVTVNLSEVLEKACPRMDKLFFNTDIDVVMDGIEGVLAGNVSEEWLGLFADALCGEEI